MGCDNWVPSLFSFWALIRSGLFFFFSIIRLFFLFLSGFCIGLIFRLEYGFVNDCLGVKELEIKLI